jgi:hypothetical protein
MGRRAAVVVIEHLRNVRLLDYSSAKPLATEVKVSAIIIRRARLHRPLTGAQAFADVVAQPVSL